MRKMKNSGIEWIGEIPSEWKVIKCKHLIEVKSGDAIRNELLSSNGKYQVFGGGEILGYTDVYNANESNLLIGRVGARCGCVTRPFDKVFATDNALVVIPKSNRNFLYYVLISFDLNRLNTSNAQPLITSSKVKNITIPVPLVTTQQKIADFLDKKCSEIDSVISKTRETIEEYKKLKQSIITEVVTGKVKIENGKVCGKYDTYKDSGVEWIGEIPSEWSVCQIKRFAKLYNGKEIENEVIKSDYAIDVYGSGGVFKYTTNYLYDGEAVLFGRKGSIGKPLIVDGKFWTVDTMYFSTCKQELTMNKFLFYLLKIFPWDVYTTKTALPSIVGSEIFNSFVPVPPLNSQLSLITFLDKKCSEIDALITKKEQLVVELETYKKSLIYEVVTGKRSVI